MNNPPSLFEMWMTGWMKMVMAPWHPDVNIENKSAPLAGIEDYSIKRISNADYELLTADEKVTILKQYRMISLDDPDFYGFWMLIPRGEKNETV